ncbi:MAG: hypothetical protein M5U28_17080 [Sandaracinaceae bacterium]|nr:hypothetical protein [Sandaracinaceae bacterium]
MVDGDAIAVARVADGPEGPRLAELAPYLASAGALRSPVPIFPRPHEDDEHAPVTDPALADGILVLRDLAVLESLYQRAEPRGARPLRGDVAALRLVASERALAEDVRRYPDGGTTVGLSSRIPARILAELPLPADRSAYLRVPRGSPSASRSSIATAWRSGARWTAGTTPAAARRCRAAPTLPPTRWPARGATARSPAIRGRPRPSRPTRSPPASITLSTHGGRDPRAPLPPLDVRGEGERLDFVTSLAARLDSGCATAGCHAGASPAAELALDDREGAGRFPAAYEGLVRFVDLDGLRARRSAVMERLLGRELEAPTPVGGTCPADEALVRDLARWIEAGAFTIWRGARDR